MLPLGAEVAARTGAADKARSLLRTASELGRATTDTVRAASTHVGGLLALQDADARRALEEFARAEPLYRKMGRLFDAARVRLDLAAAHEALGDEDSVRTELLQAGEAFSDMGATRESAMVAQRLRKKGVRPTFEAARTPLDQPISARETEVVALVAQGKSNKEIAATLFLSELTVETHMKNILRKLGLKSRAQVAAYATNPKQHQAPWAHK
jgi:DNA-binding CsgD family transcriptional regulator